MSSPKSPRFRADHGIDQRNHNPKWRKRHATIAQGMDERWARTSYAWTIPESVEMWARTVCWVGSAHSLFRQPKKPTSPYYENHLEVNTPTDRILAEIKREKP